MPILGGSKSSSTSTTNAEDQKVSTGGDVGAPILTGDGSVQGGGQVFSAGYKSTIAIGGDTVTDSRNFGTQLGPIGAGASVNVTTADPALAAAAIQAQSDTARDALVTNLGTTALALESAQIANERAQAAGLAYGAQALQGIQQATGDALASNALATGRALDLGEFAIAANAAANESANDLSRVAIASNVAVSDAANARAFDFGALALGANDAANARAVAAAAASQQGALDFGALALGSALASNETVSGRAFDFGAQSVDLVGDLLQKNREITSQTINAALDQSREAAARSENVVQSALSKLADQRAPDGANIVRVVLWIVGALAAVFALRALLPGKGKASS